MVVIYDNRKWHVEGACGRYYILTREGGEMALALPREVQEVERG